MTKGNPTIQKVGLVYIYGAGLNNKIWTEVIEKMNYPVL